MTNNGGIAASRPLNGLVVVEVGHSVAAPFAGQVLGDLGAKVIKIENPKGGDDARNWGPPFWHGASAVFQTLNRNKYSAALDLKNPTHSAALRRFIIEDADIVLQNMRPGLMAKLGLDASLRRDKPRLIYCNVAAFGRTGPLADKPGYDPLMQAFGGIMSITGEPGRTPVRAGPSIVDLGTAMWAVIAILSALRRRDLTGEGSEIDTSLYETALSWMNMAAAGYLATGNVPGPFGSEYISLCPYRMYEALDGQVMIAAGNDNLFRRLAVAMGHGEWAEDARFLTNPDRVKHRDALNALIADVVRTRRRAEWVAALEAASVPCAPLQTLDQVMAHPQTDALGIVLPTPDGAMRLMGLPVSFNGERPSLFRGPVVLGADTALVLEAAETGP
ncbi:MAG TPA: CoA transferase [Stellaceae bacterium]|nr:CoA transferase [Stellaceae bacterium]